METVSNPCDDHAAGMNNCKDITIETKSRRTLSCYFISGPYPPGSLTTTRQFHSQRSSQGQRGNQEQRQSRTHSQSPDQNQSQAQDSNRNQEKRNLEEAICNFCEKRGHLVRQCRFKKGIEKNGASITFSSPTNVTRWQKDDPVIKIRVENRDTDDLLAMLATDSGATLIRADVAKSLGLRVYKSGHDFYGLESQPVRAVGVTHLIFKVLPARRQQPLRVYVCKELPYEIILGHNFLFMSEATIQANYRGFFKILRYKEPLKVIVRIPRVPCWNYLFKVYFPKVFGPQMKKDQLIANTEVKQNDSDSSDPKVQRSSSFSQSQGESSPSSSRSNPLPEGRKQNRRNKRVERS